MHILGQVELSKDQKSPAGLFPRRNRALQDYNKEKASKKLLIKYIFLKKISQPFCTFDCTPFVIPLIWFACRIILIFSVHSLLYILSHPLGVHFRDRTHYNIHGVVNVQQALFRVFLPNIPFPLFFIKIMIRGMDKSY